MHYNTAAIYNDHLTYDGASVPDGIVFDTVNKRIILDSASVTAKEIYRAWADWMLLSDNSKYLPAFSATGGDDLGGGLSIPPYYFLLNGWRVRPMESNHTLDLVGNLFVEGGGDPVVSTLGDFRVLVKNTVPVQAQGISTSGSSGPSAAQIAAELLVALQATAIPVDLHKVKGQAIGGTGASNDPWGPA
jgi:hypothetical protein